jgi:hypothetical protein
MEIKQRGTKVYLLRSERDPKRPRAHQVVVAKVPVTDLDSLDLSLLTGEGEPKEWADYVAEQRIAQEQVKRQAEQDRLASLPFLLASFRSRLADAPELADTHADEWLQALAETQAAIQAVQKARRAPGVLARVAAAIRR